MAFGTRDESERCMRVTTPFITPIRVSLLGSGGEERRLPEASGSEELRYLPPAGFCGSCAAFGGPARGPAAALFFRRMTQKHRKHLNNSKLVWWPGTELNRRRQPFQGWVRPGLSHSKQ